MTRKDFAFHISVRESVTSLKVSSRPEPVASQRIGELKL